MTRRVLVVEDDPDIGRLITLQLAELDCESRLIDDGVSALAEAQAGRYDLVILDVMLPRLDGLQICRRLRAAELQTPILMLTAKSTELDRVLGLELGADDYLTKPFGTSELVARVRALLRRTAAGSRDRPLEFGALHVDPERREATREGAKIELTTLEFDLLWFLASRPGRVFSREQLMEQVWGNDRVVGDRSIDSLVSRLRKKVELDADDPQLLQTVWGAGYRFADR